MPKFTTAEAETVDDEPVVVEDKAVILWDEDAKTPGWVVERTRVEERTTRTTTRTRLAKPVATYGEVMRVARDEVGTDEPIYVRGDDRARAEAELAPKDPNG